MLKEWPRMNYVLECLIRRAEQSAMMEFGIQYSVQYWAHGMRF